MDKTGRMSTSFKTDTVLQSSSSMRLVHGKVIASNIEEAKKVELKYVKANAPTYAKFETNITAADLKVHEDIALDLGLVKKPGNLAALIAP